MPLNIEKNRFVAATELQTLTAGIRNMCISNQIIRRHLVDRGTKSLKAGEYPKSLQNTPCSQTINFWGWILFTDKNRFNGEESGSLKSQPCQLKVFVAFLLEPILR